jgi:hypothetical protein
MRLCVLATLVNLVLRMNYDFSLPGGSGSDSLADFDFDSYLVRSEPGQENNNEEIEEYMEEDGGEDEDEGEQEIGQIRTGSKQTCKTV